MAKIKNLPGLNIINGFKGTIDYYIHDGQACARKWPRSPGRRRAPAVEAAWPAFSWAASNWKNAPLAIKEAFNNMASTIPLTGKDLFIKSYLSNIHIEITLMEE